MTSSFQLAINTVQFTNAQVSRILNIEYCALSIATTEGVA